MNNSIESRIILTVCAMLSMISTSILIIHYIKSKESRTYGYRLVLPLFVFDLIWSINIVAPTLYLYYDSSYIISEPLCRIQGTIKLFSMLGSFFTTAVISYSLYSFIVLKKTIKNKRPNKEFAKFTVVIPLFIAIIPLSLDRYDHLDPLDNVMCFLVLRDQDDGTDYLGIGLRIIFYHIPFVCVFIYDLYVAIKIVSFFRKSNIPQSQVSEVKNILLYPMILVVSWISIVAERSVEIVSKKEIYQLNYVDLGLATINGFLNAIVYGYISLDPFGIFRKKKNQSDSLIENLTSSIFLQQNPPENIAENQISIASDEYPLTFNMNHNLISDMEHQNQKSILVAKGE